MQLYKDFFLIYKSHFKSCKNNTQERKHFMPFLSPSYTLPLFRFTLSLTSGSGERLTSSSTSIDFLIFIHVKPEISQDHLIYSPTNIKYLHLVDFNLFNGICCTQSN